jgi:hypothetical protein
VSVRKKGWAKEIRETKSPRPKHQMSKPEMLKACEPWQTPELPREGAKSARNRLFLRPFAPFALLRGEFCIRLSDFGFPC